jgi:P21-Rho-binding domain
MAFLRRKKKGKRETPLEISNPEGFDHAFHSQGATVEEVIEGEKADGVSGFTETGFSDKSSTEGLAKKLGRSNASSEVQHESAASGKSAKKGGFLRVLRFNDSTAEEDDIDPDSATVSRPFALKQEVHVGYNPEEGLVGLPKEWQVLGMRRFPETSLCAHSAHKDAFFSPTHTLSASASDADLDLLFLFRRPLARFEQSKRSSPRRKSVRTRRPSWTF